MPDEAKPSADYQEILPLGSDPTPFRLLTTDHVTTAEALGKRVVQVEPAALTLLAREAMREIAHYLRPGHLQQLRNILDDAEASSNDKFVALDLLKNANIAAGGILPMCQDTGTAIIMGKKGSARPGPVAATRPRSPAACRRRLPKRATCATRRWRRSTMYEEKNTRQQPAGADRDRMPRTVTPTSSCSWPRAAARPTRAILFQETKASS